MRRDPLTIRFNTEERAALDAFARTLGLTAAGALRELVRRVKVEAPRKRAAPRRTRRVARKKVLR